MIGTGASEFYTQDLEDHAPQQGVGSEEKVAAVRDRKLAELRQTAKAEEPVPEPVQQLWNRMGSSKERIKEVLSELYADLKEATGTETGRGIFDDIVRRYGAGDPVAKVGLARRTVYELWKALVDVQEEAEVVYAD
jgi:hypothetical protein